ncbi:MAG: PHP domain-containing protein [Oscillospiraceae bacterium]|nr:PHP domain-containing protein [Oscillospiraceae bacterium]
MEKKFLTLTEPHLHTDISLCGVVAAQEIPALYKAAGFGNLIVTDHWNEHTLAQFPGSRAEKNQSWLDGYRAVQENAARLGITVFLGMELSLLGGHEDYLVYGVTGEFLREYPDLYRYSMDEVFQEICDSNLLLYQAHPFRSYTNIRPAERIAEYKRGINVKLMHGVEVYNLNPRHKNDNASALALAEEYGLLQIAGSDFHQYEDTGRGGIYLPCEIQTNGQLVEHLKKGAVEMYLGK